MRHSNHRDVFVFVCPDYLQSNDRLASIRRGLNTCRNSTNNSDRTSNNKHIRYIRTSRRVFYDPLWIVKIHQFFSYWDSYWLPFLLLDHFVTTARWIGIVHKNYLNPVLNLLIRTCVVRDKFLLPYSYRHQCMPNMRVCSNLVYSSHTNHKSLPDTNDGTSIQDLVHF